MSTLINGMKMPTSCAECALNYDCFKCIVTGTPFFDHDRPFDDEMARLDNCPLVPHSAAWGFDRQGCFANKPSGVGRYRQRSRHHRGR